MNCESLRWRGERVLHKLMNYWEFFKLPILRRTWLEYKCSKDGVSLSWTFFPWLKYSNGSNLQAAVSRLRLLQRSSTIQSPARPSRRRPTCCRAMLSVALPRRVRSAGRASTAAPRAPRPPAGCPSRPPSWPPPIPIRTQRIALVPHRTGPPCWDPETTDYGSETPYLTVANFFLALLNLPPNTLSTSNYSVVFVVDVFMLLILIQFPIRFRFTHFSPPNSFLFHALVTHLYSLQQALC